MRRKTNIGIGFLLLLCSFSYGQLTQYRFMQPLQKYTTQWHTIPLPTAIFQNLKSDLSDLRIYGITAKNDTIEAPYLLKQAKPKQSITEVDAILRNQSHNEKGYYFTFEIPHQKTINQIQLQCEVQNFDWKVTVAGSHDQREWFTVQENYRIVSLHNELTNYEFTTIKFPKADYRYFRLLIKSKKTPELTTATVVFDEVTEGHTINYSEVIWNSVENKGDKQTGLTVDLKKPVPINTIALHVKDTVEYYRPVTIYYSLDSIRTEKGWKNNYRRLMSSTLSSLGSQPFDFSTVIARKLKIEISNHDNIPLQIKEVKVASYPYEMITRFTTPATYYLVYGNTKATFPKYDIAIAEDRIPKEIKPLSLGRVIAIQQKEKVISPLFQNKVWLWAVLILIIVLLIVFSLKMIRKS